MEHNTDIVIISYNDKPELDRCIASIKEHCTAYNLLIEDNTPPLPNRGFTKAVNDGIRKGSAPYVWLLNSDAIVLPGALEGLIHRMQYHEKVGIVGSMQLDYEDRDMIRCGGVYPQPMMGGRHRGGRISMGHWRIPEKQTWQNFASVLLRRSMIDQVGLLDESMFLICSDSSYCYTVRQAGWECWYEPSSKVVHGLKASKHGSEWHLKDTLAYMDKWGVSYERDGDKIRITGIPRDYVKLNQFP